MIPMTRNTDPEWPEDAPPGTFDILHEGPDNRRTSLLFVCPHGRTCSVFVKPSRVAAGVNVWDWDGNPDAPTLSPSINCVSEKNGEPTSGCGWHGFVQRGNLTP